MAKRGSKSSWRKPLVVLITLAVGFGMFHILTQLQAFDGAHNPQSPHGDLKPLNLIPVAVEGVEEAVGPVKKSPPDGSSHPAEAQESFEEKSPDAPTVTSDALVASGGQADPSCAPRPRNETPAQTLLRVYKQLCAWGVSGAGGVKRLEGQKRNALAAMYTQLIQVAPPAPMVGSRPGGPLPTDASICKNQEMSELLTGKLRPEGPRMIVDAFTGMGGGPELELLELRLHELDGVADLFTVVESHFGNHGDKKPMHFNCVKDRYKTFLDRIVHVRTDECPKYVKAAEKVQRDSKRGSGGVWNLQGLQRGCAVDALAEHKPALPDDALVILSDLDEIPSGKTMNILKRCELKDFKFPMYLKLKVVPFSLRTGCPPKRDKYDKGSVTPWKKFKLGKIGVWPTPGTKSIPTGGVHLSSMGSLGQVSYKLLNHGESAQIASLVVPHDVDIGSCDVKDVSVVHKLQQALSDKPISVMRHWEREKNLAKKSLKKATEMLEDLEKCELPWPLLTSPDRYPFLWGEGNLDV